MTPKQEKLYTKLRRFLMSRGIKNIPTVKKSQKYNNQGIYILISVMCEEKKNIDTWYWSNTFRSNCFDKYGSDFDIISKVREEIANTINYLDKNNLILKEENK